MSSAPIPKRVVILTAVDGTTASTLTAEAAARFATIPGSEVHFVNVIEPDSNLSFNGAIDNSRRLLEGAAESSGLGDRARYHIGSGVAWREIVQLAANLHADLIVVGVKERKPLQRMLLGSVAEQVVKKAPCPVYVARPISYAEEAPEIEPPCPSCLAVQQKTDGETLWCERHSQRHVHGRLHYEFPPSFAVGSSLIRG
jgi:nucleotide-binding universal stress UspA family protein